MALTDVDICNRALVRLGNGKIDTLTGETDVEITCNAVYTAVVESELSTYPWRFAMNKAQLSRLTETPANEWNYAFQLPTDRLAGPFAVFDRSAVGAQPYKLFEIFGDLIFTDVLELWIDYPVQPGEQNFPAYFTEFLVLAIASQIAIPITDQTNMANFFNEKAYGNAMDNGGGGQLAKARFADASMQPPQVLEDYSLVDVRN